MRGIGRAVRATGLCLAIGATATLAQQTPTPEPQPQTQEPGAGAQVHTGTSSGIETDARLQILLADHQFPELEKKLDALPPEQAQFYRGVLANRENDAARSIKLLEPLLDKVVESGDTAHEKLLRKTLAEDYLREGDMAKAAKAYEALETRLHEKLSADEQDEIEMPLKMAPLAAANPPTTVEPCEPFKMQVDKNPLGLTDVPVFVDALPRRWMLDPTAPFNLIARSTAREIGLKVSEEAVTIHTLTGKATQVHVTLIPRITIGGRLTLRNMTAFVFEDADYTFPRSHYEVEGVLAYPALQALGSLTVTSDSTIEVHPSKDDPRITAAGPDKAGARFYLDGDQIILALGKEGDERMFVVDAGGQQSYLTSRYFDEHAATFFEKKTEMFSFPGSKYPSQPAFELETLPLQVGQTTVDAHFIKVLSQPVGEAALDDVYGVLGVDVLDQLRGYTFNYRTMRFSVIPDDAVR